MYKTRQIAVSLLIVLSLLTASFAVCVCSHHDENAAASTCREHSPGTQNHGSDLSGKLRFESNDECCCASPAPRVSAKSEIVKLEKQTTVLPFVQIEGKPLSTPVSAVNLSFEAPFSLPGAFRKSKSPRAPPAA